MSASLATEFLKGLAPAQASRFADGPALEAALAALVARAADERPAVELDAPAFVAHLAARLSPETELAAVHAGDLALAFACLLGDPAALALFDREVLARVPATLRGSFPPGLTDDEVLQRLRLKLFVRQGETAPGIAGYSGRGALVHWLRAAAVRVTQDFARERKLEVATSDEALADSPAMGTHADVALLRRNFAPQFKAAFQAAMAELSAKDQNLLRLQYLDGVSPEEIGHLYHTHRTTVWRWLTACREELLTRTRTHLAALVKVGDGEFSSLMNAVHSELDVSLSRLLRKP